MPKFADHLAWDFISKLIEKRISEGWLFEIEITDNRMVIDFTERRIDNGEQRKELEHGNSISCN